ncbi:unnamed protein product [Paramecium pentaurelia]|uniref:Calcineurin-like phosphoesterase domain-containing protein n=1 Tax=Paramecium pentaurelia TaxID=43138 RepID=A0A8S1SP60_9CILI|nr:unnamed protein product [Paramecium pentaurelia]
MYFKEKQQQEKELKFVCLSDTHTKHPNILEKGDVLIHCGDFTNGGDYRDVKCFNQWLDKQTGFKYKIIIAGNHDLCFDPLRFPQHYQDQKAQRQMNYLKNNFIYLENSEVDIEGYKIWGSPHSLEYWNGSFQITPYQAKNIWDRINDNTDIVLTHGPPFGHGDMAQSEVNRNVGDEYLFQRIKQIKPKYHIFGHIHEGYGQSQEDGITFINCAYLKKNYSVGNKPITFTLPKKEQIYK